MRRATARKQTGSRAIRGRGIGGVVLSALAILAPISPTAALLLGEVVYGEAGGIEPAFVPPASILSTRAPRAAPESRLRLPILAEGKEVRSLGELLTQDWVLPGNPGLAAGQGPAAEDVAPAPATDASSLDALLGRGPRSDPLGSLQSGLAGIAAVDEMSMPGRTRAGSILRLPAVPEEAELGWTGLLGGGGPGPLGEAGLPDGFLSDSPLLPGSLFSGPQDLFPPPDSGPGLWNVAPRPAR